MGQQLAEQTASQPGGIQFLTPQGVQAGSRGQVDPCWRPAPALSDGSLVQDPDFTLPSTAGPVRWSLYHDSKTADTDSEWGWGRRASFPLKLTSDGTTVTVMRDDGAFRQFENLSGTDTFFPVGGNYDTLAKNADGSWSHTYQESGLQYHFPSGNVASVAYRATPQGQVLTFNYDGSQRLASLQEPAGRRITLGYDVNGRVQVVQDWGDRRNTLTYNASGELIEEEGPTGCITQYEYDAQHRITSILDPEGYETTYTYDPQNRVTSRSVAGNLGRYTYQTDGAGTLTTGYTDPLGRTWTQMTSVNQNPMGRIDPLGNRETYTYLNYLLFNSMDALGNTTSYAYDGNGFLRATRNALGNRWTYLRDGYGNLLSEMDPLGAITTYSYGSDPSLRQPVTVMNALGSITTYGYLASGLPQSVQDPLGNISTSVWNSLGLLETQINPLGYRTSYVYDGVGNRIAVIDALGYRTTFQYDGLGRPVAQQEPRGYVNTTLYDARGQAQAAINPLGLRTSYLYNAYGSRTALIDAYGFRTTWLYDAANALIAQQNALGYRTSYGYDGAGRQNEVLDARGYRSTALYNAAGQATAQVSASGNRTSFSYDAAGGQVAVQDALGYRHTTVYDPTRQAVASIDPLGYVSTTLYDAVGQTVASVDALARRTTRLYDPAGRSAAQQDARGYLTSFVYNAAGQQTALINANGGRWTTLYEARGNLQAQQDPLGVYTTFQYDGNGNQTLRVDGRGNRTTQTYEERNLPENTVYPDGLTIIRQYDRVGQPGNTWDATGRRLFSFDAAGQASAIWHVDLGWRLTYGYDPAGNRASLISLDGRTTYQYDGENRCIEVLNPYGERTTWQYDALGREQRKTYANGMVASHTYDAAGRETLLENRLANGTGIAVYTGTYGAVGNRLTNLELDGSLVTYAYDESYQLVREQRSGPYAYDTTYQYDGNGNRLRKVDSGVVTTYAYNVADELLVVTPPTGQPTTSTWDADGNLQTENTGGQVTTYAWNPENRLDAITNPDGTTESYVYFEDGLRQKKVNVAGTTLFVWDEQNLLLEMDTGQVVQARYTDWPEYWGGLSSQRRVGTSWFYGFDIQSSTRLVTDVNGATIDGYTYKAFGASVSGMSLIPNPFLYVGRLGYFHDRPHCYYTRLRILDAQIGRFTARDPLGDITAAYTYASNNPISAYDPTGSISISAKCGHMSALIQLCLDHAIKNVLSNKRCEKAFSAEPNCGCTRNQLDDLMDITTIDCPTTPRSGLAGDMNCTGTFKGKDCKCTLNLYFMPNSPQKCADVNRIIFHELMHGCFFCNNAEFNPSPDPFKCKKCSRVWPPGNDPIWEDWAEHVAHECFPTRK
jgi:RHS repeat-associated protein